MGREKKDVEELKEVLEVVSEKVPKLLNEISNALFSAEKAEKFGMSVANFYKAMKEAGMSDEQAFELTQKYMSSFSMGGIVGQALGQFGGPGHHHSGDDIGEEIRQSVKAKIKKKLEEKGMEPKRVDEDE